MNLLFSNLFPHDSRLKGNMISESNWLWNWKCYTEDKGLVKGQLLGIVKCIFHLWHPAEDEYASSKTHMVAWSATDSLTFSCFGMPHQKEPFYIFHCPCAYLYSFYNPYGQPDHKISVFYDFPYSYTKFWVTLRMFFFWRNSISRPNGWLLPIACHTYLESYGT